MENYSHLLVFLSSLLVKSSLSLGEQLVEEDVFISHLPDARVMAHFEFKTTWHVHPLLFSQRHRGKLVSLHIVINVVSVTDKSIIV